MKPTFLLLNLTLINILNFIFADNLHDCSKPTKRELRTGRASLIAFKPFGKEVHVGLDLLLPFVRVPTKRRLDENGQENALLIVNTASVTIAGLISGIGMFLAHLLKGSNAFQSRENVKDSKKTENGVTQSAERRLDSGVDGTRFPPILEPFKFIYRNSSGGRVEATLDSLLNTLENTLLDEHIDLNACIQKSLCTLIKRSSLNTAKGNATAMESLIDGLSHLNWLKNLIHETAIEDVLLAGKSSLHKECIVKYQKCPWEHPDKTLLKLISKRIKFV